MGSWKYYLVCDRGWARGASEKLWFRILGATETVTSQTWLNGHFGRGELPCDIVSIDACVMIIMISSIF